MVRVQGPRSERVDRFGRKEAQTWVQLSTGAESLPFVNKRACSLISLHFVSLHPTLERVARNFSYHPSSSSTSISRPLFSIFPFFTLPIISLSHPPLLFSLASFPPRFNRVPPFLPPSIHLFHESPLRFLTVHHLPYHDLAPPSSLLLVSFQGANYFFAVRLSKYTRTTHIERAGPRAQTPRRRRCCCSASDREQNETRRDASEWSECTNEYAPKVNPDERIIDRWLLNHHGVLGPRVYAQRGDAPRAALLCCSNIRDCPQPRDHGSSTGDNRSRHFPRSILEEREGERERISKIREEERWRDKGREYWREG